MEKIPLIGFLLMLVVTSTLEVQSCSRNNGKCADNPKILILGAGMAGVSAAKRLQELGYTNLTVIEGGDRIGGRMYDVKFGNYIMEQGALWVHGLGSNPIYKLTKDYNIKCIMTDYDDFTIRDEAGNDLTAESNSVLLKFKKATKHVGDISNKLNRNKEPDISWRTGYRMSNWIPTTPVEDAIEYFRRDFEYLYIPEAISLKHERSQTYDIHDDDQDVAVIDPRGYAHIVKSMLQNVVDSSGTKVILQKYITEITQESNHVTVTARDNSKFHGDYVIVTFGLGVMQNRLVKFDPPLPKDKQDSIDQMLNGAYYEVFLEFPETFWDETQFILYASRRRGYFTIWQNINKLYPNSNILHVTATEAEARRMDRLSDEEITTEIMQVLKNMYGKSGKTIPNPIRFQTHRWLLDPLFMGSFSVAPPGFNNITFHKMCKPFGRVYFAGEACSFDHSGFVQGAFYSGVDAANKLHEDIKNSV